MQLKLCVVWSQTFKKRKKLPYLKPKHCNYKLQYGKFWQTRRDGFKPKLHGKRLKRNG